MEQKPLFRQHIVFHILMWITILAGGVMLYLFEKETVMLAVNGFNSIHSDYFFRYYTQIPELALIVFVCVYTAFRKLKWLFASAMTFSAGGLCIAAGKFWLFAGEPRPSAYLKDPKVLHIVDGISLHASNSFPSGHTLVAFAGFTLLAHMSRYTSVKVLCFIMACLVAISRMYLGQHFFADVYTGACIGYVLACIFFSLFQRLFKTPVWENPLIRI